MERLGAQHASLVEQAVLIVQVKFTTSLAISPGVWYHDLLLHSRT